MPRNVVITSGKGGVGKSSICLNTALHLSEKGYRTCLFDGDLGTANANVLLGLDQEYTLDDVLLKSKRLEHIIQATKWGFDIIPGSSGVERIANLDQSGLEELAASFSRLKEYDYFLIDTATGIGRNVIAFCLASSETVLVITPEATSLTDAYALLKVLNANNYTGTVNILLNRCPDIPVARKIYNRLRKVVNKHLSISISPIGILFKDKHFELAVDNRQPLLELYPKSKAASCLMAFVTNLENAAREKHTPVDAPTFWERYIALIQSPAPRTKKTQPPPDAARPEKGVETAPAFPKALSLPVPFGIGRTAFTFLTSGRYATDAISDLIRHDPTLTVAAMNISTGKRIWGNEQDSERIDLPENPTAEHVKGMLIRAATGAAFADHSPQELKRIEDNWLLSNRRAYIARHLAVTNGYRYPDEARLCGLLLLPLEEVRENTSVVNTLRSSGADHLFCDALELCHRPPEQVQTAFDLVRIVFLAHRAANDAIQDFDPNDFLPQVTDTDLRKIAEQARQHANRLAVRYNIGNQMQGEQLQFQSTILKYLLMKGLMPAASLPTTRTDRLKRIKENLHIFFGFQNVVFFTVDKTEKCLYPEELPANGPLSQLRNLTIPIVHNDSSVTRAMDSGRITLALTKESNNSSCILDNQLAGLIGGNGMVCLPLTYCNRKLGIFLCGLDEKSVGSFDNTRELLANFQVQAASDLACFT